MKPAAWVVCALILVGCGGGGSPTSTPPLPPPSGDTNAPSVPGNLSVSADSNTSIVLSWNPSSDDTGVTGYNVYRDGAVVNTTLNTNISDTGLTTGVNYCYEVSAFDAAGNESARSTMLCAIPDNVWTKRLPGVDISIQSLAYDGSRYVAGGDQFSDNFVLISDDGAVTWTEIQVPVSEIVDIVWTDSLFIAVSERGDLYTSPDGENWTARQAAPAFTDLFAAAWSGTQAVAVGENGSTWSSPDGITWMERTGATAENLLDVAWIVNTFVAVGANGVILTSTDGETWTVQTSGASGTLDAIAGNASIMVAMGVSGGVVSVDGVTWAPFSVPGALFADVTWADGLNLFTAVDSNGTIRTSPDGTSWTERLDIDQLRPLTTVLWAGNRLLTGGDFAEIAVSTDAVNWETRNSSFDIQRVRWTGTELYAVGGPSKLATSPDGITWTYHRTGHEDDFHRDVAISPNRVVAAGQTYYMSTPSLQQLPWPTHEFFGSTISDNAVIWEGSQFVSVGTNGRVRVSADGINHTTSTSVVTGTTNPLTGVIFDGTQYVVVGYNGTIITSADLVTWSDESGATTASLRDLAHSGNRFVGVGDNGTIIYSDDGATWNVAISGTTSALYGVAWAGDEFVAVGSLTTALRSADGIAWIPFGGSPPLATYRGVAYTGTQIVVAGDNGIIATLEKP